MNTLLFTLEYPPFHGGVADYYGNLVKYWPACAKASAGKPEPNNIFVLKDNLINQNLPFCKWLPAVFALKKDINIHKINHILVGHILPLGLAVWIYSKFFKIKYSVILHGMDFSYSVRYRRKKILAKIILNNAEKIIVTNNYTAGLIEKFIMSDTEDKITIVNPGVENYESQNPQLATQLKLKYNLENKIILLSVGRLVKRKGFDMVLKAMPKLLEKIPNLAYVMVGNGEELKNFQSYNSAIIINNASDEERNGWYQACDIFIMPSRKINGDYEGFGIVYLEANLAGKPVIAGQGGGVADAVIDGLNGLMVDPENVHDIRHAIIKLALDLDLRKELGERGRQRAVNEFNWQKQIEKIYKSIK